MERAETSDCDRNGLSVHQELFPQYEYNHLLDELEQRWLKGEINDPQVVAVVLENQHSEVLLQLRGSEPGLEFAGHWMFPGGRVEELESPDAAASRELLHDAIASLCIAYGFERLLEDFY